jgi:dUTP pyrophosphatase
MEMTQEIVILPFQVAEHARGLPLPAYATAGSAGMDLHAAVDKPINVKPGQIIAVPTGLHVAVPAGYELQIRPRSGLALKKGIGLLNSPGTVDTDYRGEIMVILINLGADHFTIHRGDRIAQMVLCPIPRIELCPVNTLPPTARGRGGLGHTGIGPEANP